MLAVDSCHLPETGGSLLVVVAGLFLLATGVVVTRWVRHSTGRMSVMVAPLILLGGVVFVPAVTDTCASTIVATTTSVPETTTEPTTTTPEETVFSNDDVLHAQEIQGSGFWSGSTTDSTLEVDEPNDYGLGAFSTVWFKWVAVADGQLVLDSCGSVFDSVISVYTIDDINNPWVIFPEDGYTYLAGDDSRAGVRCVSLDQNDPAATTVDVMAETTYYIQLASLNDGESGLAVLNWDFTPAVIESHISNDNLVNAYDMGTLDDGTWMGNTTSATMEVGAPYFDDGDESNSGNNSVWFKFVAWENGFLTVDSCSTTFDSVLSAYSINDIYDPWIDYSWLDDDDSSAQCGGNALSDPALVQVGVMSGHTYYFQLDGYYGPGDPGNSGPAQLNWRFTLPD